MTPQSPATIDHHPSVTRVRSALERAGVDAEIVVLGEHARTAAAAAAQLGVTVAQIANSLVFAVAHDAVPDDAVPDDSVPETRCPTTAAPDRRRPLLVLTSGAHRVDTARVAGLVGAARLDRADPDFVRQRTGFAIGGVAPVGHAEPLRTLVDIALADHAVVWAAGGHPRAVFRTSFDELVRLTGGTPADVA